MAPEIPEDLYCLIKKAVSGAALAPPCCARAHARRAAAAAAAAGNGGRKRRGKCPRRPPAPTVGCGPRAPQPPTAPRWCAVDSARQQSSLFAATRSAAFEAAAACVSAAAGSPERPRPRPAETSSVGIKPTWRRSWAGRKAAARDNSGKSSAAPSGRACDPLRSSARSQCANTWSATARTRTPSSA